MDVITFPVILLTTSGLSILLHGVISLTDATSCDKLHYLLSNNKYMYDYQTVSILHIIIHTV